MITHQRVVAIVTAPSPPAATTSRVRRAAQAILTIAATTDAPLLRRREATVPRRHLRLGRRTITMNLLRHLTMKTGALPRPPAIVLRLQLMLAPRPSRAAQMVSLMVALQRLQMIKAERRARVRVRVAVMALLALLLKAQPTAALTPAARAAIALAQAAALIAAIALQCRHLIPLVQRQPQTVPLRAHQVGLIRRPQLTYL